MTGCGGGGLSGPPPNSFGIGPEQLLAVDFKSGYRRLAFGRDQPVDELLSGAGLRVGVAFRVYQHDAVGVEQAGVALDEDFQGAAIVEGQPGSPIGHGVAVRRRGGVQGGAHAGAGFPVPGARRRCGVDAALLPQAAFFLVGATIVAA